MSHSNGSAPPRADVIPFELPPNPIPTLVQIARRVVAGRTVTALSRIWSPGDAQRCRLCPDCSAHSDHCLLLIPGHVGNDQAAGYSWQEGGSR